MTAREVSAVLTVRDEPPARLLSAVEALIEDGAARLLEVVVARDPVDPSGDVLAARWPELVSLVDNPGGRRSPGLNRAIAASRGSVICRLDARARVGGGYVERCVARLADDGIGAVGGHQVAVAGAGDRRSRGIARALRNPWLLGGAAYRRPERHGPVDTVYLGAWRRNVLEEVGPFDEALDANEDFELCQRIRASGRIVWLEEGLDVAYEPRSTYGALFRQYHAFGVSKVDFWRRTSAAPNARQGAAVALAAAGGLVMGRLVRSPPRSVVAAAFGVAVLAAVDHAADPDGALDERAPAVIASILILGGWFGGIGGGLVRMIRKRS